jgi:EmrB/QacA subfamily drug resistance transporter
MTEAKPGQQSARPQRRRALALVTLCMAVLVAQVDTAVVNLATRAIGAYFGAGVHALQWVVDSYNLVYAALLLSGGLLADLYGRRRTFMIGAAVFSGASLLCALAPSIPLLLAGRALAGLGAALLIPASLALIRVIWTDPAERERTLGIWAACNGLALAVGPTLGGMLVHGWGWRSIFVAVIPLGVIAVVLARFAVPESADPQERRFDLRAQLLGAGALGALALAAIGARQAPPLAVAALVLSALALAGFIRIEARMGAAALVPLDLFRSPPFRAAITATAAMTFGMYGALFLVPLAWQSTGRFDPTRAGIALVPMALVFVLVSPWAGPLVQRLGTRAMTAGGVAIIGVGLWTIGLTAGTRSVMPAEIGLALTGLGMGLATGPLMGAAVGAVPPARAGTASALINVARMTGATLGVALLGTVYALFAHPLAGLRLAMMVGGSVQLAGAAVAMAVRRGTG